MLEKFTPAKADPILGLGNLFAADKRTGKIDLGVGVYKDPTGNTPVMTAVRKAEKILHESQISKAYKGLAGDEVFATKSASWCLVMLSRPGGWQPCRRRAVLVPFASSMR